MNQSEVSKLIRSNELANTSVIQQEYYKQVLIRSLSRWVRFKLWVNRLIRSVKIKILLWRLKKL